MDYSRPFNGIVPQLVEDTSLKRARADVNGEGVIRVSSVGETPVDLSTLETNTTSIDTNCSAILDSVGDPNDTSSEHTLVGLLKKIDGEIPSGTDLTPITDTLGTTLDASTDSTVIGLLKSIASKL